MKRLLSISFWAILSNNFEPGISHEVRNEPSHRSSKFIQLFFNSSTFVDKTLFIESFFKQPGHYRSLSCPKNFGKSSLLNMMKFFVQIEIDSEGRIKNKRQTKSYKLFSNSCFGLQITRFEKIIQTHLAQYPTIRVNFKGIVQPTLEKSLRALRNRIKRAFKPYHWLYDLLAENNPRQCQFQVLQDVKNDLLTGSSNLTHCFYQLSELLFCHFDRKVFVFIDDHDAALDEAFTSEFDFDINRLHDLIISMTSQLLQPKSENYVAYAFITSVTQTTVNRDDYPRTIDHYRFLKSESLAPFCGFTDDEVNTLVSRNPQFDVEKRTTTRRFFNGYALTNLFLGFYNPLAVKEYIARSHTVDISSIRQMGRMDFLPIFFKNTLLYKIVLHLCFSKSDSVYTNVQWFNVKKVSALIENVRRQEPPEAIDVDVFFWYFLENGYFTYCDKPPVHFRIPNKGIRRELVDYLFTFYDNEGLDNGTEEIREIFGEIFKEEIHTELIENLKKFLDSYVSKMTRFFHQSTNKEYHYQAVLYYWLKKAFVNVTIVVHDKDATSNVICVDEGDAYLMIQLKCKCNFENVLGQVQKHGSSLVGRRFQSIHYLAINYKRNFTQVAYCNLSEESEIYIDDYTIPKTTSSITWFTKARKKVSKNRLPWVRYELGPIDDLVTKINDNNY